MSMFVVHLPLIAGKPPLTLNQRLHWAARARRTRLVRHAVAMQAAGNPIGHVSFVDVRMVWRPGNRHGCDVDNLVPTLKAGCDGLVDAGVVPDDEPRFMRKHMPEVRLGLGPRELVLEVRCPCR